MRKDFFKNHKMSIFVMISAIVMFIGLSYAWLQLTLRGEKELTLTAGNLSLILDDSMAGGITMSEVVPIVDEEGLSQEGYTFTLENNGTIDSGYTVYLDDLDLESGQTRMNDSFIKYQLTKDGEEVGYDLLNTIGDTPNRILDKGEIDSKERYTYTLKMWIDGNATNEVMGTVMKCKLRIEAIQGAGKRLSKVLFKKSNLGSKGDIDTSDEEQTFITGEDPNNYVWYSGKLWRAVSKDTSDNSVKLVTQEGITGMNYGANSTDAEFGRSYMRDFLNDTSVDGFLGNLREPAKFIKMDSSWNATMTEDTTKPSKTTIVNATVGLLNAYEYTMSYHGTTSQNGYLNNSLVWHTITPLNVGWTRGVTVDGSLFHTQNNSFYSARPCIYLKSNIGVDSGNGTIDDPYRLNGDNDSSVTGTFLNTRYSGEYVSFGTGENHLYRIVSHEFGGTKLVSNEPLKDENKKYIKKSFSNADEEMFYNPTDENYPIAYFLNHDFLDPVNGFLTGEQVNMIEESTWYIGSMDFNSHYRLAKYKSEESNEVIDSIVQAKVGLLRLGEQFAGLQQKRSSLPDNWLLTRSNVFLYYIASNSGTVHHVSPRDKQGFRPSVHLKQSVKITGGDGTKNNPFTISL